MTVFVAVVLTVVTFAFVAYPLFKPRSPSVDVAEDDKLHELHSRRDTTYSMLKELEFDFQSGILTKEDYGDLEVRYKREAVSILRDLDDSKKGSEVNGKIEKQVKKLRRRRITSVEDEIEKQVLELRQSQVRFCPQCGVKRQESARFCAHCGASLSQESKVD